MSTNVLQTARVHWRVPVLFCFVLFLIHYHRVAHCWLSHKDFHSFPVSHLDQVEPAALIWNVSTWDKMLCKNPYNLARPQGPPLEKLCKNLVDFACWGTWERIGLSVVCPRRTPRFQWVFQLCSIYSFSFHTGRSVIRLTTQTTNCFNSLPFQLSFDWSPFCNHFFFKLFTHPTTAIPTSNAKNQSKTRIELKQSNRPQTNHSARQISLHQGHLSGASHMKGVWFGHFLFIYYYILQTYD